MAKNKAKINSNMEIMVQLLEENEVSSEMGEAFASYLLNPTVVWAKFILTDDRKNANGQRVPKSEFPNLIKSGIHMPVKMALGEIKRGHDDSRPLGVITHLKETVLESGANAIVALAALWGSERPADVKYIKERFNAGQPVNVSWEILYSLASFNPELNCTDLEDTVLRAAAVVGEPAYDEGRTQFLAVAAKRWSSPYISELPDSSFLYIDENGERLFPIVDDEGKVDRTRLQETMASLEESNLPETVVEEKKKVINELIQLFESGASIEDVSRKFVGDTNFVEDVTLKTQEELQAAVDRLTAELDELKASLASKDAVLAEKEAEVARLAELNTRYETELTPLKEFKASIDAEKEKVAKLEQVRNKFVEAGIEKDEEFYAQNAEKLIGLDEAALDFMVQELKAFAEKTASASKKTKIPALGGDGDEVPSMEELVEYLRTKNAKK